MRVRSIFCLVFAFFQIYGCAKNQARFESSDPAVVSLVSWNSLNSNGKVLGQTPVTVELGEIPSDQVIKISAPDRAPQFWVFTETYGDQLDVKLALAPIPEKTKLLESQITVDQNESHRLLMKAYQALTAGNNDLAMRLSDQLSKLSPKLAAPFIVKGLAHLNLNQRGQAKTAFDQAKTLDPKDVDIDQLLKAVQ